MLMAEILFQLGRVSDGALFALRSDGDFFPEECSCWSTRASLPSRIFQRLLQCHRVAFEPKA